MSEAGQHLPSVPTSAPSIGRRFALAVAGGAVLVLAGAGARYGISTVDAATAGYLDYLLAIGLPQPFFWAGASMLVKGVFPSPGGRKAGRPAARFVIAAGGLGLILAGMFLASAAMD